MVDSRHNRRPDEESRKQSAKGRVQGQRPVDDKADAVAQLQGYRRKEEKHQHTCGKSRNAAAYDVGGSTGPALAQGKKDHIMDENSREDSPCKAAKYAAPGGKHSRHNAADNAGFVVAGNLPGRHRGDDHRKGFQQFLLNCFKKRGNARFGGGFGQNLPNRQGKGRGDKARQGGHQDAADVDPLEGTPPQAPAFHAAQHRAEPGTEMF